MTISALKSVLTPEFICYAVFHSHMAWHGKETALSSFDTTPPVGLWYLMGDILAQQYKQDILKGKKYPLIAFPSGLQRELSDSTTTGGVVHIFGALELLRNQSRDAAFVDAQAFGQQHGYLVGKRGDDTLVIANSHTMNGYQIVYDNQQNQIVNVVRFPDHAMDLLDGMSRAALPDLYSGEQAGLSGIAPVKFFTPDANWSWYASEFDGEDMFFGLVSGLEVEIGYFSLSELDSIRGKLGLPVERDLYYVPKTLRELQAMHHGT